jgi:S1-C subfamily serine protease
MQDNASGNSGRSATEEIGPEQIGTEEIRPGGAATSGAGRPGAAESSEARPKTSEARPKTGGTRPGPGRGPAKRRGRGRRSVVAYVAAGALGIGIGFGVGGLVKILGPSASASSVIPSPPPTNDKFVQDDNGTGADNQQNILAATVPGLVHIVSSRGASVGLGLVLTPSGIVLTSNQILQGAGHVTVRVVLSGHAFTAKVVGSDAAKDLALLQIAGGSGFTPVAIGTSRGFAVGDTVTSVGSAGITKTFTLYVGNVTSLNAAATAGGRRLAGLFQTTSQVLGSPEIGGPLVNLSGQVVGIDVAGVGSGLHHAGLAIPINEALAVAQLIDAKHS